MSENERLLTIAEKVVAAKGTGREAVFHVDPPLNMGNSYTFTPEGLDEYFKTEKGYVTDDNPQLVNAVQIGDPVNILSETSSAKIMTDSERTKLTSIEEGATANSTDAELRDRSTHTGTQAISTISGLQTELDSAAKKSANLSDLTNVSTARDNLGLGDSATLDVGTTAGTVAAGDDGRFVAYQTISAAQAASIPMAIKKLITMARSGSLGGASYRRASLSDLSGYPVRSYFRSSDRYLPDGSTDATNGGYWLLDDQVPNVYQFGALGDNENDDAEAFQQWGDFCGLTRRGGFIPFGYYAIGALIEWDRPFDIESDESSILRWTVDDGGIRGDFRSNSYGLNRWSLPSLLSSAINNNFSIPGYSQSDSWDYDVNTRNGDAVNILGASRYNVILQNAQGWRSVFRPQATNDLVYGAKNVANIELSINTADFCERLFHLDAGPSGSGGVVAFNCYANTAWVKYVVYADATYEIVGAGGTVTVNGQVFHNEEGACSIWSQGPNCADFQVNLAWVSAGKANDSPLGTPANLVCGYVGGDGTSNGVSTDGGTSEGYFRGLGVRGTIGSLLGFPLSIAPYAGGYPSASLGRVRIKNAGNNLFCVSNQDLGQQSAIALASTQGEANFNGGIGGALLANRQIVEMTVPTLANNQGAVFYFYHQILSVGRRVPIDIVPVNSQLYESKLSVAASDRVIADGVNRQGAVYVVNKTGAVVPGATYYFWLRID